jgi:3-methyladenine DNA glycosylase AlkD
MDPDAAAAQADRLEERLARLGDQERAAEEKRYLKSDLDFLGATVWQIRAEVKAAIAEMGAVGHDELVALVEALWAKPIFERRMGATLLLESRSGLLGIADMPLLERLLRDSHTWALVDGLAGDVVGSILAADEEGTNRVLDRGRPTTISGSGARPCWPGSDRCAPVLRSDDSCRMPMQCSTREFFVRKAIGWVLREVGKRRPEEVTVWLAPRTHRSSGVTMREATKYLPAADAQRLMLAYREKRPA